MNKILCNVERTEASAAAKDVETHHPEMQRSFDAKSHSQASDFLAQDDTD